MKHVFLIDGSGFLFRAYFGVNTQMSRPDGIPTNAVYGFTQMLMKLVEDTTADHIAVIFDHARKTFRSDIYKDYKPNSVSTGQTKLNRHETLSSPTNCSLNSVNCNISSRRRFSSKLGHKNSKR